MTTLVLPGFSVKNREWAENVKTGLDTMDPTEVVYWQHWDTGRAEEDWLEKETEKIVLKHAGEKINIIAKSIGTMVAMQVGTANKLTVNKIILCGIPVLDFLPGDENAYRPLADMDAERILVIQNENDNHGSYAQSEKLVHGINPKIKIMAKPRSDHEYPYLEEFVRFLYGTK